MSFVCAAGIPIAIGLGCGTTSTPSSSPDAGDSIDGAPSDTSSGGDVGKGDASVPTCDSVDASAGDDGGACNDLPVPPTFASTCDPSPPPAMTGGAIVDGYYVATSLTAYAKDSCRSHTYGFGLLICGTRAQLVSVYEDRGAARGTAGLSVANGSLAMSVTCGSLGTTDFPYTATPTSLSLSWNEGIFVLRKQ